MQIGKTMIKALWWSLSLALVVGIIGGIIGLFVAGMPGAVGAMIGAALALGFSGLTTLSIRLGSRLGEVMFFGVILGSWVVKVIIFFAIVLALRGADFVNGPMLFWSLVVVMFGTLAIESWLMFGTRMTYVDAEPAKPDSEPAKTE